MPDLHEYSRVLAEALFCAYNEEGPNPWKTFDGRDVPRWTGLNEQVRGKWRAVAVEAMAILGRPGVVPPPKEQ
jgi:hypothetical protein